MPKTLTNAKQDILMTTRKLLAETGYSQINIRTIASRCGIATGTLYNYYKSKQEIVEEILNTEWNMMFRRIEQATKPDLDLIGKLEIVYNELCGLMKDVHNIWSENFDFTVNKDELTIIKFRKNILRENLSAKILSLIQDNRQDKDFEFLADVICRLFISYSHQENIQFQKLESVILALIK